MCLCYSLYHKTSYGFKIDFLIIEKVIKLATNYWTR